MSLAVLAAPMLGSSFEGFHQLMNNACLLVKDFFVIFQRPHQNCGTIIDKTEAYKLPLIRLCLNSGSS